MLTYATMRREDRADADIQGRRQDRSGLSARGRRNTPFGTCPSWRLLNSLRKSLKDDLVLTFFLVRGPFRESSEKPVVPTSASTIEDTSRIARTSRATRLRR